MKFSGLTLAALSLAASHARAGIIESRSQVMKSLLARQSSLCVSECATFQNALDACTTTACLCTAPVANGLNSCVNCYWDNGPTQSVLDAANELITVYEDGCAAYDLPPIAVTTGRDEPTTPIVTPPSTTSSSSTEVPTTSSTSRFTPVFPETEVETVEESTTEPPTTTSRPIQQVTIRPSTTAPPPSPSEDAEEDAGDAGVAEDDTDGDSDAVDDVLGGASSQRQSLGALAAVVAGAALLLA